MAEKEVTPNEINSVYETRRLNVFAEISESSSDEEEADSKCGITSIFAENPRGAVGPIFTPSYELKSRVVVPATDFPDLKNLGSNSDKNSLRKGGESPVSEKSEINMSQTARVAKGNKKRKHYKMLENGVTM